MDEYTAPDSRMTLLLQVKMVGQLAGNVLNPHTGNASCTWQQPPPPVRQSVPADFAPASKRLNVLFTLFCAQNAIKRTAEPVPI